MNDLMVEVTRFGQPSPYAYTYIHIYVRPRIPWPLGSVTSSFILLVIVKYMYNVDSVHQ